MINIPPKTSKQFVTEIEDAGGDNIAINKIINARLQDNWWLHAIIPADAFYNYPRFIFIKDMSVEAEYTDHRTK